MARKAEATLWIKLKIGARSVMKRMTKNGRSYAHKVEGRYESGSFYLRYTRNGKRLWESVGNDITLALQEQRARQSALEMPEASKIVEGPAHRMLREVAGEFLATKPRENWRHIVNVFGEWWGWDKDPVDFQRSDSKALGKYVASLRLRPRTEHNYLNQVCTFLRATGRVVLVADTEQDGTLKRAMAIVPNTLILVASDFPTVNRVTPDYYSDQQIDALLSNVKSRASKPIANRIGTSDTIRRISTNSNPKTMKDKINFIRQNCIEANPSREEGWDWDSGRPTGSGYMDHAPCRLADVLLAIYERDFEVHAQRNRIWETADLWNLGADDLEKQSEKTINFLYELLK